MRILLSLALGSVEQAEKSGYVFSSIFESFGGLLFVGLALTGYVAGEYFFSNLAVFFRGRPLDLYSSGIIPLANIAIGIKVGAGLFAVFVALGASRFAMKE